MLHLNREWIRGSVLLGVLLVSALLAVASGESEGISYARPAEGPRVVINELLFDPPPGDSEAGREWVELFNAGNQAQELEGWQLHDNRSADDLPAFLLMPGDYLVVAGGEGFAQDHPDYSGALVVLGGSIGNGLGNSGDRLRLLDASGSEVDGISYGEDATLMDPPASDVEAGHSLERVPAGSDTDEASDWMDQDSPSPGEPASDARPPVVPTAAPPATVAPGTKVLLNEYLPAPKEIDWDGDGEAGQEDEWIELFNAGDTAINLRGWHLDDVADGGSSPYVFPDGTRIESHGHLLIFKRDSGLALNNSSDSVRLLYPDGTLADQHEYVRSAPDQSLARLTDGDPVWTDMLPASPGGPNQGPGPGQNPTPVPSPADPEPSAQPQPSAVPSATLDPEPQPSTTPGGPPHPIASTTPSLPNPTPPAGGSPTNDPNPDRTPAAPPILLPLLISEVMFDPAPAGNDAWAEWVEVYNRSDAPVSLAGWALGDRRAWDALGRPGVGDGGQAQAQAQARDRSQAQNQAQELIVPPKSFAIIAASARGLAELTDLPPDTPQVILSDGRIGGGLANGGDMVRLRGPTGQVADALSYGNNLDAFDPAVPIGPPGSHASVERIPPDVDTDSAADWWPQPAPSPGRAGAAPEGPPPVRLNEILPSPGRIDWDGSGVSDFQDEWVEIYNAANHVVDLGGWWLEDRAEGEGGWRHVFPEGLKIEAGGFHVAYRRDTGIALRGEGETLRLYRPEGVLSDGFSWPSSPGRDRSWSRSVDGRGEWTKHYAVTKGGPNIPRPKKKERNDADASSTIREASIAALRKLPASSLVRVSGLVTAPPGVFGSRTLYLEGDGAGIQVYLGKRGEELPSFALGESVTAIGRLKDYHGEREIVLAKADDIIRTPPEPGVPIGRVARVEPPRAGPVNTGAVGEALEGRLVRVAGAVVGYGGPTLTLDDGSGALRVVVREATGIRRPWVEKGEWVEVAGIVGQYAKAAPWEGGYRLMPRFASDFGDGLPGSDAGAEGGIVPSVVAASGLRTGLGLLGRHVRAIALHRCLRW